MHFDKDRVVITGAGGGLGRVLCSRFAAAGATVVACDLPGSDLSDDGISERHYFDLSDGKAVQEAAQKILAVAPPAIFISNAGWAKAETLDQLSSETLSAELNDNFVAAANLSRAFLPGMRKIDGAAMVFISSVNAQAHFGQPAYSAAKAALHAWARAIAVEEGQNGIRANLVLPGSIRTNAWTARLDNDPEILDRISRLYPMKRIVTPDEVVNAVLFLASPLASGITGTTLNVDAGLRAGSLPFIEATHGG